MGPMTVLVPKRTLIGGANWNEFEKNIGVDA